MAETTVNVLFAGIGGQGVLTAADICAQAAFLAGFAVKKAEVHGMSQRGGSVVSEVRWGAEVLSPMVPALSADALVVLADDQAEVQRHRLRPGGLLLVPADLPEGLAQARSANVAMLGLLARRLRLAEAHWLAAIRACLAPRLHEENLALFTRLRSAP